MYVDVLKRDVFFDLFYLFSIINNYCTFLRTLAEQLVFFVDIIIHFLFGCLLNVCNFQCYII